MNGSAALKLNGGAIQSVARPTVNANIALSVRLPGNDGGHKVNGVNSRPSFGAASVAGQRYTPGVVIPVLDLPAATGGDGALTYSLNHTSGEPPCRQASGASGASGSGSVGGASGVAIPIWMSYHAPGTT